MISLMSGHDVLCQITWPKAAVENRLSEISYDFKHEDICPNDMADSIRIDRGTVGATIKLYASPYAALNADHTVIKIKQTVHSQMEIPSLEKEYDSLFFQARHYGNSGLNGNVSYISIQYCGCQE